MNQFEVLRRESKEIDGTSITIFSNLQDIKPIKQAINKYKKVRVIANVNGIENRFQYINPEIQWSDVWGNLYEMKSLAESNDQLDWKIISKDTAVTMNQRMMMPIFYHQQDYESWIHPFHKAYISQSPIFPSFSIVERERFVQVGGFKEAIGIYEDTILFCEMCGDMTVENSFKVKKIHSFAGTKDNHDECSAFGGNQSGMFDRDGESHKQVAREVAEKYLHFDVSPSLNSQMDDETKSALCDFRFEREFQIHL